MSKAKDKKVKGAQEGQVVIIDETTDGPVFNVDPRSTTVDGILLSELLYEYRRAQRRTGVIS